ncbi:DUF4325 domain-containing protein [Streptococcus gallolyticus]|uniref:DUF4325 domain-containing protein n=1 Tax=Streptococcus gallolyticus TaxID=315405 RepID=UPI0008906E23|nr:DUF4325 domain-containing protein [Streptococcus gallolyticus]NLM06589.1 DUF4325 domain-containing protein [Tissierellia bacterium]SDK34274.1 hypothetical protein SAMN04487842_2133 [Streptococcus gallolyticus]SDL83810.1 hypothetical protein SAMN04487841_2148 [Streptococcus gallolyticus]
MKTVKIQGIPDSLSRLIGFELGVHIYKENNLDDVNLSTNKVKIIFPDTIEKISSSFVQGFFAGFIKRVGKNTAKEQVIIEMKNDELTSLFYKKLY